MRAPPVLVTADFVAFTADLQHGQELMNSLRTVSPPELAARLRAVGLLADDPRQLYP